MAFTDRGGGKEHYPMPSLSPDNFLTISEDMLATLMLLEHGTLLALQAALVALILGSISTVSLEALYGTKWLLALMATHKYSRKNAVWYRGSQYHTGEHS
jgi:hypothetical protein